MNNKPFPTDWNTLITARGVTKNVAARSYNVRISVAGKQLHVATSLSQAVASRLYDIAVWKLCPKMKKIPTPNDGEVFSFCTQRQIDSLCPRLNRLYESLPYLHREHEMRDEDTLRELALRVRGVSRPQEDDAMHDYDCAVEFLRRAVVELADLEAKLANRMGKLTKLHKLAGGTAGLGDTKFDLGCARRRFENLKNCLESQRAYYQKLIDTQP